MQLDSFDCNGVVFTTLLQTIMFKQVAELCYCGKVQVAGVCVQDIYTNLYQTIDLVRIITTILDTLIGQAWP